MPDQQARQEYDAVVRAFLKEARALDADMASAYRRQFYGPYTPLKLSRRSRLRYRWTMATESFRRSLARRIYDFEDGW